MDGASGATIYGLGTLGGRARNTRRISSAADDASATGSAKNTRLLYHPREAVRSLGTHTWKTVPPASVVLTSIAPP